MGEPTEHTVSRRELLKIIAATGGALAASTLLPGEWARPVVEAGVLPAHAQQSPPLGTGDFQATLTWNQTGDVDLHTIEPSGYHVYFAQPTGPTASLDYDNTVGYGPENIFVPPGGSATGVYQVFIVYWSGQLPITATIRIRVFVGTAGEHEQTFTRYLEASNFYTGYNVADVTYPAGTITETFGTRTVTYPAGRATK